jgi:hypothetical protein
MSFRFFNRDETKQSTELEVRKELVETKRAEASKSLPVCGDSNELKEFKQMKLADSPKSLLLTKTLIIPLDEIVDALKRRISKSIEKIENDRKILQTHFKIAFYKDKLRYQFLADCYEIKNTLLKAGKDQLVVKGSFDTANKNYKRDLEKAKTKLAAEELDRINIRIKDQAHLETKEQKSEIVHEVQHTVESVSQDKDYIKEFEKFELGPKFNLEKWKNETCKNTERQYRILKLNDEFLKKNDKEELDLVERDSKLRTEITKLTTLKASLNSPLKDNLKLKEYLLENIKEVDQDGFTSLSYSCVWNNSESLALELIMKGKPDIKTEKGYAFHFVLREESHLTNRFLELLKPNFKLLVQEDSKHRSAFDLCAYYGNLTALKWMISKYGRNHKFNLVAIGTKALKLAASKGQGAIVEYLLPLLQASNKNISNDLQEAIGNAFYNNHPKVAEIFYNAGNVLSHTYMISLLSKTSDPDKRRQIQACFDTVGEAHFRAKEKYVGTKSEKIEDTINNHVAALFGIKPSPSATLPETPQTALMLSSLVP